MKRAQRVSLVNALVAVCAAARLRNATRVAEAPRLVGERVRGYRHNLKKEHSMETNFANVQREHDAADVTLRLVFGDEYSMLPATSDMVNVRKDYILAFREDGCTGSQYRDRIGKGNLRAYAESLAAGLRAKARRSS